MKAIDEALDSLGLGARGVLPENAAPRKDARFDALAAWMEENLRRDGTFRDDERVILFTEYKTTLDYVQARLAKRFGGEGVLRVLYGGMPIEEREAIKAAFNDPADPVRILLATDAASEGLNLQETARFVVHWDVPWNPARLEQRNGRLDRHGQPRDVVVAHFATDDDADLAFLAYVVRKVNAVREDLGSTGEVFDVALQERLVEGASFERVREDVERKVREARARAEVPRDSTVVEKEDAGAEHARIAALQEELDLDPEALRLTLDVALGIGYGRPRLDDEPSGRYRLTPPVPSPWRPIVDDTLRVRGTSKSTGALAALTFDPRNFIEKKGEREVFRPAKDTILMHLSHPVYQRALGLFARARFPGGESSATRWTARRSAIPAGLDALVLVTVEELAVNELRESFHHWVHTLRFPIRNGDLGAMLPHEPAARHRAGYHVISEADVERARDIWSDVERDVQKAVKAFGKRLQSEIEKALARERAEAQKRERERFQSRRGELSAMIEAQRKKSREQRLEEIEAELRQEMLFYDERRVAYLMESKREILLELDRSDRHYEELRAQLEKEQARVLDQIVPSRFAMRGEVQVLPVAVEIRLPEVVR